MRTRFRGFTIVELIVVVLIAVILIGICLPVRGRTTGCSRTVKDGTQVRSIHQSMITWAGQCQDNYPFPSQVDLNDTIPGTETNFGASSSKYGKDLPRFVLSLLMYNGSFGPEITVSPSEVNPAVGADNSFEFKNPSAVILEKRSKAILDPAFACYPDEMGGDATISITGHFARKAGCSYAFVPFVGARRSLWQSTFDASQCIIGNRGPWYKLNSDGTWSLDPSDRRGKGNTPATQSNTLLIHGARSTWEGNVARNDNSVAFETRPDPTNLDIKYAAAVRKMGIPEYDNIFANEDEGGDGKSYTRDDDRITPANFDKQKNNYLRCWGGDGKGSNLTIDPVTKQITSIIDFWYD